MNTLQINGFTMSYELRGKGEPLFLLHGMCGAGANWDLLFPTAIEGFQTIIPDLRGHGHSDNPLGQFSIRQCAADVLALADKLKVERFKAIGLSLGGNTMLHVASGATDRVDAMVIVSATPYFTGQARAAMKDTLKQSPGKMEVEQVQALHAGDSNQMTELRRYIQEMSERDDDMNFDSSKLATITAKTLIVHGEKDPFYSIDEPVMLYKAIPNTSLWVVPGAGHGPVFMEHATAFAETSIKFLQS